MRAQPLVPAPAAAVAAPAFVVCVERLRCLLLWLTGASGAIVFIEPSPFEAMSLLGFCVFAFTGLSLRASLLPLAMLLLLINLGYSLAASAVVNENGVIAWVLTSWYLALTALFFAAALGVNTQARLNALAGGCLAAAVVASAAAIIGYSRLFPAADELLLLYERARGTFKDPNVLGAFLIFPSLLALQRMIFATGRHAVAAAALLVLFAAALFLTFSRAAWGGIVLASMLALLLMFLTARLPSQRLRIVVVGAAGAGLSLAFVIALLSIDTVAELFRQRAEFGQSYDVGAQGRFARYELGTGLALDAPFGIGPLQFSKYFSEDPHNSYLNAFMSGGWLSGACHFTLVLLTLVLGLRYLFVVTPWQHTMIAVYAGYAAVAAASLVIDSDHWRHGFLLLGVLWGLIAATSAHGVRRARPSEERLSVPKDGAALARS
jgi:hypothetical protein